MGIDAADLDTLLLDTTSKCTEEALETDVHLLQLTELVTSISGEIWLQLAKSARRDWFNRKDGCVFNFRQHVEDNIHYFGPRMPLCDRISARLRNILLSEDYASLIEDVEVKFSFLREIRTFHEFLIVQLTDGQTILVDATYKQFLPSGEDARPSVMTFPVQNEEQCTEQLEILGIPSSLHKIWIYSLFR